ncbi:TetR/AcrR family transcriptional repressor of mexCD-oprJ operon [Delftia sp. 60]|uniref:TetR/AcrR family transcriptional regulator n=1 Tax=Delftia sp. 60 TaxID=2035216 RepID=UPI000C19C4C9|nr:TetR/AcrR family transcriptional regulator [Delftia sp. 60]PIF35651.1 TetR/AcrR family transcriptional repressor of mexCD-oprJ operon [Burkholderiales bacterium 23]PIF69166.1 TetR/AcrR family transcriptional repressor of mexCD-oprJ operon [Delftia sp. 60]
MTSTKQEDEGKLLGALALALLDDPKANLQELARAIGISKATLYRFCPTRDQLIDRLIGHAADTLSRAMHAAELERHAPLEALRRLTAHCQDHQTLLLFLMYFWRSDISVVGQIESEWVAAMDAFFLRGQQAGVFRIDITAAAMTELWLSMAVGLLDAERRGRVARASVAAVMEQSFLHGALQPSAPAA